MLSEFDFYRNEFQQMIIASTSGYNFSLSYIYDTVFKLISNNSNYKLVCEDYSDALVQLITYPRGNRSIRVLMTVFPDATEIGEHYVKKLNIEIIIPIIIPFDENNDFDNNITVNYLFFNHYFSDENKIIEDCVFKCCSFNSFYELFSTITENIDMLYAEYGIDSKSDKINFAPSNAFEDIIYTLRESETNTNVNNEFNN